MGILERGKRQEGGGREAVLIRELGEMGDTASFCTEVRKEKEDDAFGWRTCNMGLALQRQKERTNKRKNIYFTPHSRILSFFFVMCMLMVVCSCG